jgi:hypothetical protein
VAALDLAGWLCDICHPVGRDVRPARGDPRAEDGEKDGAAYFGNEARVNDWPENGGAGISGQGCGITVPTLWLEGNASMHEGMTKDQIEYAIPYESFDELDEFPRAAWSLES